MNSRIHHFWEGVREKIRHERTQDKGILHYFVVFCTLFARVYPRKLTPSYWLFSSTAYLKYHFNSKKDGKYPQRSTSIENQIIKE